MPVAIKGTGGGSVTLTAGTAAADTTLTLPNTSGTLLQSGTAVTVAQGGTGLTSPGTSGNVLTSNGSAWTSAAPAGGGIPTATAIGQIPFSTDGSTYTATQKIVQGTAVASTSGTSIDFTSIPSWVKRVTIMFNGVSTNGSSSVLVQLGTSGGIVSSGYNGVSWGANGGSIGYQYISLTGVYTLVGGTTDTSASTRYGSVVFYSLGSNIWVAQLVMSNSFGNTGAAFAVGGYTVSLGAALTTARITTVNGTDAFDAGSINILYE